MKKRMLGLITFFAEYGGIVLICIVMKCSSDYTLRFSFLYFIIQFVFGHYNMKTLLIWEEIRLLVTSHFCFFLASSLLIPIVYMDMVMIFQNIFITIFMLVYCIVFARYVRILLRTSLADNVLIIGTGQEALVLENVSKTNRFTLTIIKGFIDVNNQELYPNLNQEVLVEKDVYPIKDLVKILKEKAIDQVIIAVPDISKANMDRIMVQLHNHVNKIKYIPSTNGLVTFDSQIEDFDGLLIVSSSKGERTILKNLIKRCMDILGGVVGCIALIPLTIFVKHVNKKNGDHGPVFYTQNRIGLDGKHFKIYKYRTMVLDAEKKLADLMERNPEIKEEYEQHKKLRDDPRITKAGKFLREKSLDEFPQFINTVKGEMSLVGPRPYLPNEKKDMGIYYDSIAKCKPGITGMWQSHGRSDVTFDDRCRMDDYYYCNWSTWLDLTILIKTFKAVFYGKGAI